MDIHTSRNSLSRSPVMADTSQYLNSLGTKVADVMGNAINRINEKASVMSLLNSLLPNPHAWDDDMLTALAATIQLEHNLRTLERLRSARMRSTSPAFNGGMRSTSPAFNGRRSSNYKKQKSKNQETNLWRNSPMREGPWQPQGGSVRRDAMTMGRPEINCEMGTGTGTSSWEENFHSILRSSGSSLRSSSVNSMVSNRMSLSPTQSPDLDQVDYNMALSQGWSDDEEPNSNRSILEVNTGLSLMSGPNYNNGSRSRFLNMNRNQYNNQPEEDMNRNTNMTAKGTGNKTRKKKANGTIHKGFCKWFHPQRGYGFITSTKGEDYFVHQTAIKARGYRTLAQGEAVEFQIFQENGKSKAMYVTGPNGGDVQGNSTAGGLPCTTNFGLTRKSNTSGFTRTSNSKWMQGNPRKQGYGYDQSGWGDSEDDYDYGGVGRKSSSKSDADEDCLMARGFEDYLNDQATFVTSRVDSNENSSFVKPHANQDRRRGEENRGRRVVE